MSFAQTFRLIAVGAALALFVCSSAAAGTYTVTSCSANNAWQNHAWVSSTSSGAEIDLYDNCNNWTASPVNSVDVTRSLVMTTRPTMMPGPAIGEWKLTAPAGSSITSVRFASRQMRVFNSGVWRARVLADSVELEGCSLTPLDNECKVGPGDVRFTGLSASTVSVGAHCVSGCVGGGAGPRVAVAVGGMVAAISDPIAPTIAPVSGTLVGATDVTGAQSVTVGGSDASGIRAAEVLVDGNLISRNWNSCDLNYVRPCAVVSPSWSTTLNVDTTSFANGPHTLTARVYDAADNMATSTSSFTVRQPNLPTQLPPASDNPTASAPTNPRLKLSSVKLKSKKLTVKGTIDSRAVGEVRVKVRWTDSKKKSKSKTYVPKRSGSSWTLITKFTSSRATVSVSFVAGSSRWASVNYVGSKSVRKAAR